METISKRPSEQQIIEEFFYTIWEYLDTKSRRNLSMNQLLANSVYYGLFQSKMLWGQLMTSLFQPIDKIDTTFISQSMVSNKSTALEDSMMSSRRTPKVMKLKQETMNSNKFSSDAVILQPVQSPRTLLAEKRDYNNEVYDKKSSHLKDLNKIKNIFKEFIEKFTTSLNKVNKLFSIATDDNNSLTSEINILQQLKKDLIELNKDTETESMKKLTNFLRNDLAKKDPLFKELYKDFSERKRSISHFAKDIEQSALIISEVKGIFQKCLNSSLMEYKDLIELILNDADAIQNEYQAIAQNFNNFLFTKMIEFLRLKFKENKIDVENALIPAYEEFSDRLSYCIILLADIGGVWKGISEIREKQYGEFSTKDGILTKKITHFQAVLSDLEKIHKYSKNLRKAPEGSLIKSMSLLEKEKKINGLAKIYSFSKMNFDIFSWDSRIHWLDLKKSLKESLDEMKADKEKEDMLMKGKMGKRIIKPSSVERKSLEEIPGNNKSQSIIANTSAGFFKKVNVVARNDDNRPQSSFKLTRNETTEEEQEYLRSTFHPDVKWKVI